MNSSMLGRFEQKMSINLLRETKIKRIIFFVQIFDGKNHRGGAYEKFIGEYLVELLNGMPDWGMLFVEQMTGTASTTDIERANAVFLKTLRGLLDQFIETGIDTEGIETPSNRRVRASVNEPPIPLFDTLLAWLGRNMPKPALNNDGTIAILPQTPNPHGKEPEEYAREMAVYYFEDMLDSPARLRIGKCRNPRCQKYFLRKRAKLGQIKRGTYCGECKLIGGAERTRLSRFRRKSEQIQAAADAWRRWQRGGIRASCANWVAQEVNRRFQMRPPIKQKWVNQNKRQILALVSTLTPPQA